MSRLCLRALILWAVLLSVVIVVVLQCSNANARRPRRQNLLSLRFGARLLPSARQLRLSMQTLSNTAHASRTSVKVSSSSRLLFHALTSPSERERERKTLAKHAAPISAQLRACERTLCCVIEGVGPDQLLIRYSLKVDESSRSTHEVSFVLDVSSSSYKGTPLPLYLLDAQADNS